MTSRANSRSRRWLYRSTLWGALAAGTLLAVIGLRADPRPALPLLVLFLALAVVTESGHLTLPYAGYVSFGAVVALPAIIVVGPGYAALFGALGQFVSNVRRRRPMATVLFNPGQKALCIAVAGAAWNIVEAGRWSLGAVHPDLHPARVLPAALVAVAVYTLATHIVVSIFSATRRGLPVQSILIGNAPMRVAAACALGSSGLLVALLALGVRTQPRHMEFLLGVMLVGGLALLDWDFHRQTSRVQRAAFERSLERAIAHGTALSVVNVRIDAVHRIDTTLQDEAFREAARLLTLEYQAHVDVVSRRGGTELVGVLPQTGRGQAAVLAARIQQIVAGVSPARGRPAPQHAPEPRLTVRIGIASYPDDGRTVDVLLRAADRAMRAIRPGGRRAVKRAIS
jgi:diguanylate cyclase (GGDEF)-like protein